MLRHKPRGWPRHMSAKRLANGATGYFWQLPPWARKPDCPLRNEPLGTDYGAAKQRCDEVLNPQLDAWRQKAPVSSPADGRVIGSFDWLVAVYKSRPRYKKLSAKTRKDYDACLRLVADFKLKDGRRFGAVNVRSITPGAADRIYDKLRVREDGTLRTRTAQMAMVVARAAWQDARRDKPKHIPTENPFAGMALAHKAKATRPVTHDELVRFVAAADEAGEPSIGTAAMIAFYWLQRQTDIVHRLTWAHYRPALSPDLVRIWHHKTGAEVDTPLADTDGTSLFPELTSRLDALAANLAGTPNIADELIVRRSTPSGLVDWRIDYFRHRVAAIRAAAGIDPEAKFMGLRHGGNTEGANAGLTDAQLRALSGHKTSAMVHLYAKATMDQRREGARKRRDQRTKTGSLSE